MSETEQNIYPGGELDIFGHKVLLNVVEGSAGVNTELYFPDLERGEYGRIEVDDAVIILPNGPEEIKEVFTQAIGKIEEGLTLPQLWQVFRDAVNKVNEIDLESIPHDSPAGILIAALKSKMSKQ